jgi:hypothetical protein
MIMSPLIIATFLILFELRQVWTCLNYIHKILIKPHPDLLIQGVNNIIPHLKHRPSNYYVLRNLLNALVNRYFGFSFDRIANVI